MRLPRGPLVKTLIDNDPYTGQHFGLYAWKQSYSYGSLTAEADFDEFSISGSAPVPLPASLPMFLLGFGLLSKLLSRRPIDLKDVV